MTPDILLSTLHARVAIMIKSYWYRNRSGDNLGRQRFDPRTTVRYERVGRKRTCPQWVPALNVCEPFYLRESISMKTAHRAVNLDRILLLTVGETLLQP